MFSLFQVLLDSVVSSFHNLHHLFFVVRKLLKEVAESSQKPPMNSTDDSNVQKFSSEGGFLRQPVFEISPGSSSGHLNIVDPESWDNFCCLVANSLWPSMLKCLVEGKAFIDSKISQVRFLEIIAIIAYQYTPCKDLHCMFGYSVVIWNCTIILLSELIMAILELEDTSFFSPLSILIIWTVMPHSDNNSFTCAMTWLHFIVHRYLSLSRSLKDNIVQN